MNCLAFPGHNTKGCRIGRSDTIVFLRASSVDSLPEGLRVSFLLMTYVTIFASPFAD